MGHTGNHLTFLEEGYAQPLCSELLTGCEEWGHSDIYLWYLGNLLKKWKMEIITTLISKKSSENGEGRW